MDKYGNEDQMGTHAIKNFDLKVRYSESHENQVELVKSLAVSFDRVTLFALGRAIETLLEIAE